MLSVAERLYLGTIDEERPHDHTTAVHQAERLLH
jgi:hypothetical protein